MHSYHGKPWKSLDDQLVVLKQRGLIVTDDNKAKNYLQRIGYYRFSGYAYPFRQRSGLCCTLSTNKNTQTKDEKKPFYLVYDDFVSGVSFEHITDLYVFDKNLRILAMDALERIEIAIRSQIAYQLGEQDPLAYLNPSMLHETFTDFGVREGISKHHEWITKQARLVSQSKEDFIKHHRENELLPAPIWVACELWDFGAMSHLFGGMKEADQDAISGMYGITNGRTFATWLRALNYLRNVCAHHCRLWNRNMVDTAALPPANSITWVSYFDQNPQTKTRVFQSLCICAHLMKTINPKSTWVDRVTKHLKTIPDLSSFNLGLVNMGATADWEVVFQAIKNP